MNRLPCLFLALMGLHVPNSARGQTTPTDANALEFFEKRVRPLLVTHCSSCHGSDPKKRKGGLDLSHREAILRGGDSGPAAVPGKPDNSLLIQAIRYNDELKMPPKGKLKDSEIADLTKWVQDGLAWPSMQKTEKTEVSASSAKSGATFTFSEAQKQFWAFQPMKASPLPEVKGKSWVQSPIDAFILAALEAKNLQPAPPADKRTLLRRVTFDLTGLPPTPEEINAFLADDSPNAWEKVIDRLLMSPAYGERWARHWLDVARYADSNGLDENTAFANAWRYRDYVVRSLNQDKPYDQFVREQLAGDLLTHEPGLTHEEQSDRLIATGFLVLGPKLLAEPDKTKMVMDIVDEQIDVTSKAFLGLTFSCSRCHDHKFDPLPTRDYYGWAGIFKSTKTMASLATVARALERPLKPDPETQKRLDQHQEKLQQAEAAVNLVRFSPTSALAASTPAAIGLQQRWLRQRQKELEQIKQNAPPVPMALAVEDEAHPAPVRVHIRGNHLTLGEEAPRIHPRILAGEQQVPVPANRSGRLELAQWLTRPDHPLTARVMVNRVWLHHFGQGIVRSPDNFGQLGERPTHPELLDWLALDFVQNGWSLKKLHKTILMSNTYRMSTAYNANAALVDPDNRLLWRMNRRRLEAEAIRDAMLAVSGKLDRAMGGSFLATANFNYVGEKDPNYNILRRSLYLPVVRSSVFDFFQVFDFVEPSVPNGKRNSTVVAPQALYLMNNEFVRQQATAFAERIVQHSGDDREKIRFAYLWAWGRLPNDAEIQRATAYLQAYNAALSNSENDAAKRRSLTWASWCQTLLAANEFLYLN